MPSKDPARRRLQGRTAAAIRLQKPEAEELRRELATVRLAAFIREVVDAAPPLTDEQRRSLQTLLNTGAVA